jgi:hypothetical protein
MKSLLSDEHRLKWAGRNQRGSLPVELFAVYDRASPQLKCERTVIGLDKEQVQNALDQIHAAETYEKSVLQRAKKKIPAVVNIDTPQKSDSPIGRRFGVSTFIPYDFSAPKAVENVATVQKLGLPKKKAVGVVYAEQYLSKLASETPGLSLLNDVEEVWSHINDVNHVFIEPLDWF